MKVYKAESAVMPQEWDFESSADKVYHNTNIELVPATEEMPAMYEYDVAEYTNKEYMTLTQAEQDEAIDEILIALLEG